MTRALLLVLAGAAAAAAAAGLACRAEKQAPPAEPATSPAPAPAARTPGTDAWAATRAEMVERTIAARGVTDARVLAAMKRVPRHELVPAEHRDRSYEDRPLPIGFEQTISQPYIVAAMTEAAQVAPGERVLEVGTGSGYQAAVLAELGADVYSIERERRKRKK